MHAIINSRGFYKGRFYYFDTHIYYTPLISIAEINCIIIYQNINNNNNNKPYKHNVTISSTNLQLCNLYNYY